MLSQVIARRLDSPSFASWYDTVLATDIDTDFFHFSSVHEGATHHAKRVLFREI